MPAIASELSQLKQAHLYRRRRVIEAATGGRVQIEGREYLAFCSNDYLGLAQHPDLSDALQRGARQWGVGSGASHLVSGHTQAHHALEEELADFVGRPRALLFSTGYMANLGVITSLCGRGDEIYEDRLNHASLLDGALLAQARLRRYPHNDADALRRRLEKEHSGRRLIATDAVFSMDGDIAPLAELVRLAGGNDTPLLVDDAHGLGVLGPQGRGSLHHLRLEDGNSTIFMGTLGKALGTFGAFVAGDEALIEYLINRARSYIYTTALPPAVAEATRVSLRLVKQEDWRRQRLHGLIARFRQGAGQLGLTLMDSQTPIQPLLIGDAEGAIRLSEKLLAKGILISAIRPPTVPKNTARLRITFSATHSEADVDRLLDTLDSCLKEITADDP